MPNQLIVERLAGRALLIAVLARLGGVELLGPLLAASRLSLAPPDEMLADPSLGDAAAAELEALTERAREALDLMCG